MQLAYYARAIFFTQIVSTYAKPYELKQIKENYTLKITSARFQLYI